MYVLLPLHGSSQLITSLHSMTIQLQVRLPRVTSRYPDVVPDVGFGFQAIQWRYHPISPLARTYPSPHGCPSYLNALVRHVDGGREVVTLAVRLTFPIRGTMRRLVPSLYSVDT